MCKKVIYLGYYNVNQGRERRSASPAGENKMSYVIGCLQRANIDFEVISPVNPIAGNGYVHRECFDLSPHGRITFLPSFAGFSTFSKLMRSAVSKLHLTITLLSISKDDTVIVYHSPGYQRLLKLAKRFKKFRLVLEIEELYQDIEVHKSAKQYENALIKNADAYILSSATILKRIPNTEKVSVICCGNYKMNSSENHKYADGKIHCVYAGTFETQKGGALLAIRSAQYLTHDYHIHILGFGSDKETAQIKAEVDKVNGSSDATVTFDGKLSGTKFQNFLQRCHIGLSTQRPDGEYNDTSFPSKILTYLTNGLKVVSVGIPAVVNSPVSQLITTYKKPEPAAIAHAITAVGNNTVSVADTLRELDNNFINELKNII